VRGDRVAIVLTPILALATLAVGMRVGARRRVHAAIVYAAPRAHGASAFAWQVVTLVEDSGGREAEPQTGLTVHARDRTNGREATWHGDTNEDGVAEIRLDLPTVGRDDAIDLEVLGDQLEEPLARGRVGWDDAAWADAAPGPFVRPSKRVGAIAIDAAILGGKLVARSEVALLVRATSREDGHPIAGVTVTPDPEPGLDVRQPSAVTCPLGWARLDVSPKIYNAALGLRAKADGGRTGEWFSGLPVAVGTIRGAIPDVVKEGEVDLTVLGQTGVYAEVDDRDGRAFGGWAKLPTPAGDRATFHAPALGAGLKWLLTSSDPRGAEVPDEATIARPFLVSGTSMPAGSPAVDDSCAIMAYLALHPAGGFHRSTVLDGFVSRKDTNAVRRKRGLAIGLGALGVAAVLELVLLLRSARRGRDLATDALEGVAESAALMRRSSAGSIVVGLLLAVLGFALLAALLLLRA
jgi:hypothetical protein